MINFVKTVEKNIDLVTRIKKKNPLVWISDFNFTEIMAIFLITVLVHHVTWDKLILDVLVGRLELMHYRSLYT